MNVTELKPCPFCGGKAVVSERYIPGIANRKHYWVECIEKTRCCEQHNEYRTKVKAIEAWNRRESNEQRSFDFSTTEMV